jgi:hypothetical protein
VRGANHIHRVEAQPRRLERVAERGRLGCGDELASARRGEALAPPSGSREPIACENRGYQRRSNTVFSGSGLPEALVHQGQSNGPASCCFWRR